MAADTTLAGLGALDLGGGPAGAGARDRAARIWAATWPKLAAIVLAWVAWELIHLSGWKKFVLPGPGVTLSNLWGQLRTGLLWHAIGDTLERAVVGYALALVIGTVVGLLVARVKPLRAAVGSLITGLQTMPSIMWFPLAILLFQISESAILFVVVIGAAPSVANGLISGIDYVPRTWLRVGQVLGMKGIAKYRHLILPASLPSFISGLKQGWAFSWRSLMAGELLVIVPGALSIGVRMQQARDLSDSSLVICYIIVVLVIGILIDVLFNAADNALRKRWGLTGN